ncbi:uncharacterized protein EI90DRAFT_3131806 [Cantharellus anzutake]|uniref:uncharacterized protein n=1 Tax=Cantharellus anzutake TaxID=1750568 RepID=UPI001903A6E8|nr:uncharacterized protein EI90DRAFT_3131806 [Cantharellus anzutake]KAF8320978.1 hypothetical protein EI90DRAFT_3131806 [Cantharellus anzutake]
MSLPSGFCRVCLRLLENPHALSCGHFFCEHCLPPVTSFDGPVPGTSCPICGVRASGNPLKITLGIFRSDVDQSEYSNRARAFPNEDSPSTANYLRLPLANQEEMKTRLRQLKEDVQILTLMTDMEHSGTNTAVQLQTAQEHLREIETGEGSSFDDGD